MSERIVVLGFLSHFPVAGVAWQTIHYLLGFQRLGYEVMYVEAHGCTPSKLMQGPDDDGARRAAEYIDRILRRFGLGDCWAYHELYPGDRVFGRTAAQLREIYRNADLIINLHGSHRPTPETAGPGRLIYVETDPGEVEIDVLHRHPETLEYLEPHAAFFTFGENLGRPGCLLPKPARFDFKPTRQPVLIDFWEKAGHGPADRFTTIGNWNQPFKERRLDGEIYLWSKHLEFAKFIDLPRCTAQPFELALSSCKPDDQRMLEEHGWLVRSALEVSQDLDVYRGYIGGSRGEFTVAKDQNIRLRSGWFSDRAATYLAAGRPVITQDTAFGETLPTGMGLFAFSTQEEILSAVDAINSDYERHRRAAFDIARGRLAHDVVLGRMIEDLGLTAPALRRPRYQAAALDPALAIQPVGRWPTRLPEATMSAARELPLPAAPMPLPRLGRRLSVVVTTFNGLPFTKMCVASLLRSGWRRSDELILVDNGSTDGTREWLAQLARRHSFVRVIANEANRGFAAANNQGLALAKGDALVLLNNDTLVAPGWRDAVVRPLGDPRIGLLGPVTNHTCNEAEIDVPYATFGGFRAFAAARAAEQGEALTDLRMLAMFCLAMRRDVHVRLGPLDERFEIGMYEDDDYALRARQAGLRIVCAEGLVVHHFGQASLGDLCGRGDYERVLQENRRRFEEKWQVQWQPHGRRITPEYRALRERVCAAVSTRLPAGAVVAVINKGDEELLKFAGREGRHFPAAPDGRYANAYPADGAEALAQLEAARLGGVTHLVVPSPARWWLDHYAGLRERLGAPEFRDDATALIFALHPADGGTHG